MIFSATYILYFRIFYRSSIRSSLIFLPCFPTKTIDENQNLSDLSESVDCDSSCDSEF